MTKEPSAYLAVTTLSSRDGYVRLFGPYDEFDAAVKDMWKRAEESERDACSTTYCDEVIVTKSLKTPSVKIVGGFYDECGYGPFVTKYSCYMEVCDAEKPENDEEE